MKKIQTHRYRLKYIEINMQICQLWSVVIFLLTINRLFLIRDAKFKMNQKKKKSVEFKIFYIILILLLKNNSNFNNFQESYWEKIF
jgi:hypothetical protein